MSPRPTDSASARSPTDLRLLIPALTAWAVVAAVLGVDVRWVVAGALGMALALVAASVVAVSARRTSSRLQRVRSGPPPRRWLLPGALTAAATTLVLLCLATHAAVREAGPVRQLAAERAIVTLDAVVTTQPRRVDQPSRRGATTPVVLRVLVESVTGRGSRADVRTPVLVIGDERWLAVRWHERVRVEGRLSPADDPADDVVALLDPTGPPTSLAEPGPLERAADVVRDRFRLATQDLPADARGLLPGLVIGDTDATPADLRAAMLTTGMTHLSAVSGSNVAIVLAAALGLCRLSGLRRRWRPLLALLVLGAFVVLVRPEPSVIRAAVMGGVALLGMSTSRRSVGIPALAGAIIVLLCWDPWLSRSFGFGLSVLATLGLLLFAGPWGAVVARVLPSRIKSWGPAFVIPAAAQLMCAPLVVLLQGSVSLVGVLANLLAAPLVAPATVIGVTTVLLSVVWTGGAALVAAAAALPTLGIAWVARACSQVPMATLAWPDGAPGAALLALLSLTAVVTGPWLLHHGRRRPWAVAACVLLGVGVALPTGFVTWPAPGWLLVACDVGQGDGLVLRSGLSGAVVVDVGPDPEAIDGCLSRLGVTVVDAVVLTHFHADHVDGLPGVLRDRQVRQILATPVQEPAFQAREVRDLADAAGVPLRSVSAGDDLRWPGIAAHVWWPERVIRQGSVPNNASVVLTVDVSGLRVALLGDVEREAGHAVLLALRAQGGALADGFDVVKVAHHGSANRDDGLLAALRAPVALVSVGADNDYGHPAPSTLSALQTQGYRVSRTDRDGDIAVGRTGDGAVLVAARH